MLRRGYLAVRALLLRRRLEREMREEMAGHLERATERLEARGLSREEARLEALREFGNVAYLQEEGRNARGGRWVESLAADTRFALRHFGRRPLATLTMLVVLATGMGISATLFSFLHAYATQPPTGIPAADDLVRVRGIETTRWGTRGRTFTAEELEEYRGLTTHLRAVAGWMNESAILDRAGAGDRQGEGGLATFVTPGYFAVLGVQPILGPGLPSVERGEASAPVAVIGYGVWDRFFGRSPAAIGSTLMVNGVEVTVVGVAPRRFGGVNHFDPLKIWMPASSRELVVADAARRPATFYAAGRLPAGVGLAAASAATGVVAERVAAASGETAAAAGERELRTDVVRLLFASGDPNFDNDVRLLAIAFTTLGLLVLAVTCMNVSALMTGLALARRREIAIRLSIGAARARLVRQLLTESVLLAGAAAAGALALVWLVQWASTTYLPDFPLIITVSAPAVAFTFGVALAVGILFGLSPALHATRLTVGSALKDSSAGVAGPRGRLQRALVIGQIAFTQPLIVGVAALLLTLAGSYREMEMNPAADRILSLRLRPAASAQPTGVGEEAAAEERRAAMKRLAARLSATPAIEAAIPAVDGRRSLEGYVVHPADRVGGGREEALRISAPTVAPGYFAVMAIPLVMGRELEAADTVARAADGAAELPVVIGAGLARTLWPGVTPIGRRLQPGAEAAGADPSLVVVGVVEQQAAAQDDVHRVYLPPTGPQLGESLSLLIRGSGDAERVVRAVRGAAREEAPGLTVVDLRSMAELEAEVRQGYTVAALVLGGGGLLALLLAVIGLYAVTAFAVGQRIREIAVRMAVGARAPQIVGTFVREGLRLSLIGMMVGLPLSLLALRALQADFLPAVAMEPVIAVAALGAMTVALAGSWLPARRAARVDPASILRRE